MSCVNISQESLGFDQSFAGHTSSLPGRDRAGGKMRRNPKSPRKLFLFFKENSEIRGLALAFRKRRKRYFEAKKRHGVFNCLSNE